MSSKNSSLKRRKYLKPDPLYNSLTVNKVINKLMFDGKKSTAQSFFYKSLQLVKERTNKDPIKVFNIAIENIKPLVEVKPIRIAGATYQVPVEISLKRQETLAIRWLIDCSRKRKERTISERICNELIDAMNNQGNSLKKRDEMHKTAEGNRAFSHFRW